MEPNVRTVRSGFVMIAWAKITLAPNVKLLIYPSTQKDSVKIPVAVEQLRASPVLA
tara:strand:+ start:55 stop:222 length:168 start_codon:yes stop_codon:yes gene_type:complete